MRRNYKLKVSYDLRENFGNYLNADTLDRYYNFNSNQRYFNQVDIVNLKRPSTTDNNAQANNVKSAEDSPYRDVLFTALLDDGNQNYYRIPKPYDTGSPTGISIAGWYLIPNKKTGQTVLFSKVGPGNPFSTHGEQKLAYNHATQKLEFTWRGTTDITLSTVAYPLGPTYTEDSSWIHVAVTMKGTDSIDNPTAISDVIKICINGEFKQDGASGTGGDAMAGQGFSASWTAGDYNGDMVIGRGQDDDASSPGDGKLSIYDFAIWGSDIPQSAIKSIWSTSKYHESSGILTAPVRIQLADTRKIGPVNISRPALPLPVTDKAANQFNDMMTPVFLPQKDSESSVLLRYPLGIPENIDANLGGVVNSPLASSSIQTPNLFPDIVAPGSGTLVGEYHSVESRGDKLDQIAQGEVITSPFNDASAVAAKNDSFYLNAFPGFEGHLRDKIQLNIELPLNQEAVVGRHSSWFENYGTHDDPQGPYYRRDLSGFLYYNSELGTWEQLGLNRPVSGVTLRKSNTAQVTKANTTHFRPSDGPYALNRQGFGSMHSGSFNILRMFYPGGTYSGGKQYPSAPVTREPVGSAVEVIDPDDSILLSNIGHPMISSGAPNGTQYHATSSQTLKMSNYISEPFLLEKVILEIPDTVARENIVHGNLAGHPSGMVQPQRDYMFFLMRQARNFPGDRNQPEGLDQEVSSSMRYIICSGSACFFNSQRNVPPDLSTTKKISDPNNNVATYPVPFSPKNSPAFSHDWGVDLSTTLPNLYQVSRSGSLFIPMIPASPSQKSLGNFYLPGFNGVNNYFITQSNWLASVPDDTKATGGFAPFKTPAYWPGGTSTLPLKTGTTGSRNDTNAVNFRLASNALISPLFYRKNSGAGAGVAPEDQIRTFFEVNLARFAFNTNFQARTRDPRTFAPWGAGASRDQLGMGGLAARVTGSFPDSLTTKNRISPYLLFPEDELVLGVDAAFGPSATLSCGVDSSAPAGTDQTGATSALDTKFVCGANNITGSILTMNAGKPIRIRLFGSRVKDQKRAPDYPSQVITQESITEPIIGKNVLDQFQIGTIVENSGSYLERFFTGSMINADGSGNTLALTSPKVMTGATLQTALARNRATSRGAYTYGNARQILGEMANVPLDNQGATRTQVDYPKNDPRSNGPGADRLVLTCSIPTAVTGFGFSKFYIRFWTSNDVKLAWPQVDAGSFGGSVTRAIGSDEIYIGTVTDSNFFQDDMMNNLVEQLKRAIDGTSTHGTNSRVLFGSGIRGVAAGHDCPNGIPNVTLENFEYNSSSNQFTGPLKFKIDPRFGAVGNRAFIVEGFRNKDTATTWTEIIRDASADDGKPMSSSFRNLTRSGVALPLGYANVAGEVSSVFFPTSSFATSNQDAFSFGPTGSFGGGKEEQNSFRQLAATANRRNLGDFGSFQRFTTLVDKNETYFDSLLPKISDIWRRIGNSVSMFEVTGGYKQDSGGGQVAQIISKFPIVGISAGQKNIMTGTTTTTAVIDLDAPGRNLPEAYNSSWWASFPFEPKINAPDHDSSVGSRVGAHKSELGRQPFSLATQHGDGTIRVVYNLAGDTFNNIGAPSYMSSSYGLDLIDADGEFQMFMIKNFNQTVAPMDPSAGLFSTAYFVSPQIGIPITMENLNIGNVSAEFISEVTAKVFYGCGDASGYLNLLHNYPENHLYPANSKYVWPLPPKGGETKGQSPNGGPDENGNYQVWAHLFRRSSKPRGWKYGLRNVMPTLTQCVFRGDTFGQNRDMLEQRKYTVFADGPGPAGDGSAVFVQFVEPPWLRPEASDVISENPYETNSQNMSNFATSSLPFFDTGNAPAGATEGVEYPYGRDRISFPPEVDYVLETSE